MQKHEKKQSPYRIKTARDLARADIVTEPIEYDTLHVTLGGKRLCGVSNSGCVGHYQEDVTRENDQVMLELVHAIARMTCEYMTLMEQAPSLSASGLDLEEGYRAMPEFNSDVLAGKMTHYGAQFVTWEWVRDLTSSPAFKPLRSTAGTSSGNPDALTLTKIWRAFTTISSTANRASGSKADSSINAAMRHTKAPFAGGAAKEISRRAKQLPKPLLLLHPHKNPLPWSWM